MRLKKRFVVGVTGSIASYKSADLVSALRDAGGEVTVVMTQAATKFLAPLTLETLSGRRVVTDLFSPEENLEPVHTRLANWADMVVIYPASAKVIGKIAHGICDDALTCVVIATHAQVLMAPAMNDKMYQHQAVKNNIKIVRSMSVHLVEPEKGKLACGYEGVGRVAAVDTVLNRIKKVFK